MLGNRRSYGLTCEESIEDVLSKRTTQSIRDLHLILSHIACRRTMLTRIIYLESVKDDIELDRVLTPDRMVHLARIRESQEDQGRNDQ